jgi:hypothetical protein
MLVDHFPAWPLECDAPVGLPIHHWQIPPPLDRERRLTGLWRPAVALARRAGTVGDWLARLPPKEGPG